MLRVSILPSHLVLDSSSPHMNYHRHTKPGGWVEFKDWDLHIVSSDDSLPQKSFLYEYHQLLMGAIATMNREYAPGPGLKKWAEDAGYVNVTEKIIPLPIGMWPKDKKMVSRLLISFFSPCCAYFAAYS